MINRKLSDAAWVLHNRYLTEDKVKVSACEQGLILWLSPGVGISVVRRMPRTFRGFRVVKRKAGNWEEKKVMKAVRQLESV